MEKTPSRRAQQTRGKQQSETTEQAAERGDNDVEEVQGTEESGTNFQTTTLDFYFTTLKNKNLSKYSFKSLQVNVCHLRQ